MNDRTAVLVVDDEEIVCKRLRQYLGRSAYAVETCTNSEAALQLLAERTFDVVVTDLRMKGPSGLDVLQSVTANSPSTQVIIITGYASMESLRDAEYLGAYHYVTKPIQMRALAATVKGAGGKARRLRQGSVPANRRA